MKSKFSVFRSKNWPP